MIILGKNGMSNIDISNVTIEDLYRVYKITLEFNKTNGYILSYETIPNSVDEKAISFSHCIDVDTISSKNELTLDLYKLNISFTKNKRIVVITYEDDQFKFVFSFAKDDTLCLHTLSQLNKDTDECYADTINMSIHEINDFIDSMFAVYRTISGKNIC